MADRKKVHVMVEEIPPAPAVKDVPETGMEASCSGEDFNPELAEILYRSLGRWMELGGAEMETELRTLEGKYRSAVYSELLYLLSHLRFPGLVAKSYWREIVELRSQMEGKLGEFVDIRVALSSYFVHVNRKIRNSRIIELQLFEQAQSHAHRDELTGLYNARFFSESLDREMLRSRSTDQPMSLVMVDLDEFKDYNDRHGREAGDVVLAEVARLLSASLRVDDLVARYGGEEFAVILPSTSKPGARLVAERARAAIEARDIPHEGNPPLGRVTVSMGIATFPGDVADASALLRCADRALYGAKSSGRNLVELYGQDRRSFTRVEAALTGRYRPAAGSERPMTTLNISEGGVRFVSDQDLSAGLLLEVRMELPAAPPVTAVGRVVQSVAAEGGRYECSARIVHLEREDRFAYQRYITGLRQGAGDEGAAPEEAG